MCDHGCACDNLLQNVPSVYCTAQAQTNESCITMASAQYAGLHTRTYFLQVPTMGPGFTTIGRGKGGGT